MTNEVPGSLVIYRVWRSELPRLLSFGFASVASVVVSRLYPATVIEGELISFGDRTYYLSLPLLWLIPVGILLHAIMRIYDARYVLDQRGIESRSGILGLRQVITRVCYEDIRSIETDQSILQRFLDVGTIDIGTAATGMVDITMTGIRSPREVQELIQSERDRRQNGPPAPSPEKEQLGATGS